MDKSEHSYNGSQQLFHGMLTYLRNLWNTEMQEQSYWACIFVTVFTVGLSVLFLWRLRNRKRGKSEYAKSSSHATSSSSSTLLYSSDQGIVEVDGVRRKKKGKHIMISYNQKDSSELANKIYNELHELKYDIWFDKTNMCHGNIYDKMTEAVENSYIFLMLVSPNYETSLNCISEASMARENKIPILPVNGCENYSPTKVTKCLAAGIYYYQFNEENFDQKFKELHQAIKKHTPKEENYNSSLIQKEKQEQYKWIISLHRGSENTEVHNIFSICDKPYCKNIPNLNEKQKAGCSVFLNEAIYYIGGKDPEDSIVRVPNDQVFRVDVSKKKQLKWKQLPSLMKARCDMAAAVLTDDIYVTGGFDGDKYLSTAECLELDSKSWKTITKMNTQRQHHQLVACQDKLYAIAGEWNANHGESDALSGESKGSLILNTVEQYDPDFQKWNDVEPMTEPRKNFAAAAIDNRIYVVGGYNGKKALDLVEVYDVTEQHWVNVKPLKTKRHGCVACVIEDKLYVIGGKNADGAVKTIDRYSPETDEWDIVKSDVIYLYDHAIVVI